MFTTTILLTLLVTPDDAKPAGPSPIAIGKLDRKNPVTYEKDIAPLFAGKCRVCHEGKNTEGGYDLSTYALAMKGGKRGAKIIVPGKAEESFLWQSSSHRVKPIMPPKSENNPLTPDEVAVLKRWIDEGAKGPAMEIKTRAKVVLGLPPALVNPVRAMAITPDNKYLMAGRGNQIHLFDTKTGNVSRSLIDPELKTADGRPAKAACLSLVESMAISPDGQTVAVGTFGEVVLWNIDKGTINRRLSGFTDRVVTVAFSPNGKYLATGSGAPTEDGELRLHDPATGQMLLDIKPSHSDTVFGLSFSPDNKLLATAGADKFVKVFEVPSGQFQKSFEGHTSHVLDVTWTPDGKRLVSVGADNFAKVWDYEKGEKARDIRNHDKQISKVACLPKKTEFVTVAGDGVLRFSNHESGGVGRTLTEAKDFLYTLAVSSDGALLASGGEEGIVRLYSLPDAKLLKSLVIEK
jgi:WD40 repeat protein